MCVSPPKNYELLKTWHDRVIDLRDSILVEDNPKFSFDAAKREEEPVATFSCIPWIDFDMLVNCISGPHHIQPLIMWGKVSKCKISVSLTFNHIFVFGTDVAHFYENIQKYFDNPNKISCEPKNKNVIKSLLGRCPISIFFLNGYDFCI